MGRRLRNRGLAWRWGLLKERGLFLRHLSKEIARRERLASSDVEDAVCLTMAPLLSKATVHPPEPIPGALPEKAKGGGADEGPRKMNETMVDFESGDSGTPIKN